MAQVDRPGPGQVSEEGDTWADYNRRAADSSIFEMVEHYPAGDTADLALRLHREGLIYRINREVLHPLGLALGINGRVDPETMLASEVHALTLNDTGGGPVRYDDDAIKRNEAKLRRRADGAA